MQVGSKRGGKCEISSNAEMKAKAQLDPDKKVQESLDNIIRQTIGRESFLSFAKVGDSPVQWIHLLDTLEQQNAIKAAKDLSAAMGVETSGQRVNAKPGNSVVDANGVKNPVNSNMKVSGVFGRGLQASAERIHSLKIPEAVVAFAHAAAKSNDLPGWPLVPPSKVQMQKCEKCSQEFYSVLNYRRHIRMHCRSLHVDQEVLRKERAQLAAFWDKLSSEDATHIVSVKNLMLEEVAGSSFVKSLTTFIKQPGLSSFPRSYLKAGEALLDVVQSESSRFPLSSNEILDILDDSSEKTFLCGVLSASMQRFIFGSEAGKVGLEAKNLIASLGFLVEQRLVRAWMADKDAEALRCQKALVEEEEAAQKKREKLLERKRLRKIRRQETKDKERKCSEPVSGFYLLDDESDNRRIRVSQGEEDDSPTITQSSPSSSECSGQDINHAESSNVNVDEFDGFSNGNIDNIFSQSVDEVTLEGADELEAAGWTSSSNATRKVFSEESDALMICRTQDESKGPATADQESNAVETSNVVKFHEGSALQSNYVYQKAGYGTLYMEFKTRSMNRFTSDRKIGQGWRERKRHDLNDFTAYQKPFHGADMRTYDAISNQSQGFAKKPYGLENSVQETLSIPMIPKPSAAVRFGQYHDRPTGIRKSSFAAGNSHAVWTKKAHQTLVSEPDSTGEVSNAHMVYPDNMDYMTEAEARQHSDGGVTDSFHDSATSSVPGEPTTQNAVAGTAMPNKSDGIIRCNMSVSFETSCFPSSENILVEEQAEHGLANMPVSNAVVNGSDVSNLQTSAPEDSGALVIGSLSIPLGQFSHPKCFERIQENSKCSSAEIEIENSFSEEQNDETSKDTLVKVPMALGCKSKHSVYGTSGRLCGVHGDHTEMPFEQFAVHQASECTYKNNPLYGKPTNQGFLASSVDKVSAVKPGHLVGELEMSATGLGSGTDAGYIDTLCSSISAFPSNADAVQGHSSGRGCPDVENDGSMDWINNSASDTGKMNDDTDIELNFRTGDETKCVGVSSLTGVVILRNETIDISSEMDASEVSQRTEFRGQQSVQNLETKGFELKSQRALPKFVASFLSQRWAVAVASSEPVGQTFDVAEVEPSAREASMQEQLQKDDRRLNVGTGACEHGSNQDQSCGSTDLEFFANKSCVGTAITTSKVHALEKQGSSVNWRVKSDKLHQVPMV